MTSFEEFKELARRGTFVPVCKEIVADLLTPVSAFLKIAEHSDYAFLLESVEGGEHVGALLVPRQGPVPACCARATARRSSSAPASRPRATSRSSPTLRRADGRLPVAVRARPAALHRRRGRLPRLRRRAVVRAGARAAAGDGADPAPDDAGLHAVRHGAGLRPRPAPDPDHRQRAHHGRRRPRGALPVRVREDRVPRARARARPVAAAPAPAATPLAVALEHHARALRGRRAHGQGAHRRRRHLPGRAVAALRGRRHRRPVHGLPRAAAREPVALHVFHPHGRRSSIVGSSPEMLVRVEGRRVETHPIAGTRPRGTHRGRGPAAGRGAEAQREGARRARDARRPRPQRPRPRLRVRHRCACRSSWRSSATRT